MLRLSHFAHSVFAVGVTLALTGCVAEQGQIAPLSAQQTAAFYPQTDYAAACLFVVNAPGAYVYTGYAEVPTVVAGGGGTKAGADAMNACIRGKVAENKRTAAMPDVAGVPQRVETRTNGNRVAKTYTYGTPPAAQSTPAAAATSAAFGNRQCSLRMTGGTGYTCVGSGW